MGLAAVIMGVSVLLSRFTGLIRDKVISYLFGATRESDLYFAAFVIPDFINYLLAGAYFSITLIPLLALYFGSQEEEGWKFFSSAVNWIGACIIVLTLVAMAFAKPLARIAAPGLPPEDLVRLAYFLRIVMPAQVCFLIGSCFTAILYLRRQFLVPALIPIVYNGLIILGGVLLRHTGMEGFCWGVLAGALVGNLLLPVLAVKFGGGLKWRPAFTHPGLKRLFILALPLMIGQSIVVLDEQLVRIFGSLVGEGAVSWLNYARRIMLVPVGVVAQAAGVASYPFLAQLIAQQDFQKFHATLNRALEGVLFLLIPMSVWMIIVARPTITLIFQQGQFGVEDTLATTRLLQISLVMVFCWGIQQIVGRAFYARQDTLTPAVIGTLITIVCIPLFYLLTVHLGAMGVALASAASIFLYTLVLSFWWSHKFGLDAFRGLGATVGKVSAVTVLSAAPAVSVSGIHLFDPALSPYLASLWQLAATGLIFATVFLLFSLRWIPHLVEPVLGKLGPPGRWLLGRSRPRSP